MSSRTSTLTKTPAHRLSPARAGRRASLPAPDSGQDFLRALGDQVRGARAQRGMTRRILARDSGISERYLAQLEAGHGNVSVLLLRQLSMALNLPLQDLLREPEAHSAQWTLTLQLLKRLPPGRRPRMRQWLLQELAAGQLERSQRIALIGLRGAGKSTLGARLAAELGVPFVEIDREIEREAGTSLSEIFLLYGQAGYRRYERRCLEQVLQRWERCVIASGGSLVSEAATFDLLLSACFTVWLKALPEEHMTRVVAQGDTRPMADNPEAMADLRRILDGRESLYRQADAVVDTAGRTVERSLRALRQVLRRTLKTTTEKEQK